MNTAIKVSAGVIVVLLSGGAMTGLFLPDSTLRTITGSLGDKAVRMKHAVIDDVSTGIDDTLFGLKSWWWDLSDGRIFDGAPRLMMELPQQLRDQFAKSSAKSAPEIKPEPKPEPAPESKPEPEPKPEPKPESKPNPAPEPKAETKAAPPAGSQDVNGDAAHKRGLLHYKGDGVPKDYRTAAEWFGKAAAKGHPGAQYYLGFMAYLGQGAKQDFAEAAKWFQRAGDQGHANSQYHLGFLFYEGKGVKKDDLQAYAWIDRAASQGHKKARTVRDALAKALPREILKSR